MTSETLHLVKELVISKEPDYSPVNMKILGN